MRGFMSALLGLALLKGPSDPTRLVRRKEDPPKATKDRSAAKAARKQGRQSRKKP